MKNQKIIEALCRIPRDFRERGDVSMVSLLKETGYVEMPDQITVEAIELHLKAHPELVEIWQSESQDKRSSPAWYLMSPTDYSNTRKAWVVGNYPSNEIHEFKDGFKACAFYIKKESEQLREIANNS
jgi:hypothetical protein